MMRRVVALQARSLRRFARSRPSTASASRQLVLAQRGTDRSLSTKRPISPHVQIYKFPPIALSSITNRITGTMLSIGCAGMGAAAMGIDCDIPSIVQSFKESAPILVPVAKFAVAFPLSYHFLGGARHLYWDATLKGFDTKSMDMSSYALFGSSLAISVIAMFVSF